MTALTVESQRERALADRLRDLARTEINHRGIEESATELGLARSGVEALLWRRHWPLEVAIRVIDGLDLPLLRQWQDVLEGTAGDGGSLNAHASGA